MFTEITRFFYKIKKQIMTKIYLLDRSNSDKPDGKIDYGVLAQYIDSKWRWNICHYLK